MLIQSDYHIHASFYRVKNPGAYPGATAAEQQASARGAGCRYVGILEHCNHAKHHPFHCLEELSAEYYGAGFNRSNTFLGVEADLNEDGSDACGVEGRKKLGLHYVIGSVHLSPAMIADVHDYIKEEYHRLKKALQGNSNIDVIGHPFGEGYRWVASGSISHWGFDLIPADWLKELNELAVNQKIALEMNRILPDDPVYVECVQEFRKSGGLFSIGSDAHSPEGCIDAAVRTQWAESLGFEEENHWKPAILTNR